MAGIQEILTLLLIIIAIIFIPRILTREKSGAHTPKKKIQLSGRIRIGIVISIIVPVTAALFLKPWNNNIVGFISTGIIPVAAGWAIFWIFSGFKRSDLH